MSNRSSLLVGASTPNLELFRAFAKILKTNEVMVHGYPVDLQLRVGRPSNKNPYLHVETYKNKAEDEQVLIAYMWNKYQVTRANFLEVFG